MFSTGLALKMAEFQAPSADRQNEDQPPTDTVAIARQRGTVKSTYRVTLLVSLGPLPGQ